MNQDEIIRRLTIGEGFNNIPPERINTHISTIFLIGDDAYKLKHAVATSYLNYSSLENRRRFCQAELDINRLTAPQIYLDLVPVRVTPEDELVLGEGPGEPIEWLVHMRRFSQDSLFDTIADEGGLTQSITIDLADEIAAFHKGAMPVTDNHAGQRIATVIDENERELLNYVGATFDEQEAAEFTRQCRSRFAGQQERIIRRGDSGFVRHCHGDLHLRNICLIDGKPTLFDAIEFSDDISLIDTLFDLAFLLMDLEHRSQQWQANLLFNRYLYRTEDVDDLALLPLYMALRAGIRAHTSAMAAEVANDENYKGKLEGDARNYLQLGLRILEPHAPSFITMGGFSGVGKSTVAAGLAPFLRPAPGALILSSDLIRKRQLGAEPLTRLSETAYVKDTDESVYAEMLDTATRVLSDGHSVILDATFQDPMKRLEAESLGHLPGIRFHPIWLEANSAELYDRVDRRENDPSDANLAVLARQLNNDVGEVTWDRIDASRPPDAVVRSVHERITAKSDRQVEEDSRHEPYVCST